MHADQLAVSEQTVAKLVDAQFPRWQGLPVSRVASQGTVNAIFRIGDELTARFPLRRREPEAARAWLEREAEAARELLGRTRFPTPEPVAIGEPGFDYPMPWSVQTWLPGAVASEQDPAQSVAFAVDLAEFIKGVRGLDTGGRTFPGGMRGGHCSTTTTGCRPAYGAANSSWTSHPFAGRGRRCVSCRAATPPM
jgi:aminoglycoside phosphotransferase (APT) family kinase protein